MKLSIPKTFGKISLQGLAPGKKVVSLLELIAGRAFELSLGAIFIAAILGFIIVTLQYRTILQRETPSQQKSIRFSQDLYQQVLKELEARKEAFEEANRKEYPNLFVPAAPLTEGKKGL